MKKILRSRWFLLVLTVFNMCALAFSLWLHFGVSDVVVNGVPLKNCTSVQQPGVTTWTCHD